MKSIRVFDKDINLLAEIDNYEEFKINRKFYGLSSFEFSISSKSIHIDKLEKENLVVLGKYYNKVGIILHKEQNGDRNSDVLTVRGVTLQGLINRRVIVPDIGQSFESKSGKQETIIKHFVNKNCVNPTNPKRIIPRLTIARDELRGRDDAWRSSYDNLSDKIKEICEYCELGWDVVLDKDSKTFIFDVVEGKNLTINQVDKSPVIFRSDFNNIANRSYLESIINTKNVIYAGTAEDSEKLVLSVGDIEGFERIETFKGVNSDDPSEIIKEGQVNLKELEEQKTFEINVNPTNTFVYEIDYDLGDVVTVQDRELSLTMDTRIVEIEEIHNMQENKIKLTFGTKIPNIISKVSKLERSVVKQSRSLTYEQSTTTNYSHNQISASKLWTVNHNLDKYPSVTVTDSAGSVVVGDIKYISTNSLEISFNSDFSGIAYLN